MGPEFGPVFGASEYWHISRGLRKRSHFGACIFWCWRTTFELIFGIAQSGRGATISSATCSRRTPKCSQLMLALNTYSFQTIKLKLAAFLPSAAPTVQYSCGSVFFLICSIASHRTLLLSLSMNLQQLKKLCCWMEWQRKQKRNGDQFLWS